MLIFETNEKKETNRKQVLERPKGLFSKLWRVSGHIIHSWTLQSHDDTQAAFMHTLFVPPMRIMSSLLSSQNIWSLARFGPVVNPDVLPLFNIWAQFKLERQCIARLLMQLPIRLRNLKDRSV